MGTTQARVAVLSDIHGNRWALEAVLADAGRRGLRDMVNLGDTVYGPLDPAGTADILLGLGIPTVRGNQDRAILEGAGTADSPSMRFVRDRLRKGHLTWLAGLESTLAVFDALFLCHGTPQLDTEYLLSDVRESGVVVREPAGLEARTSDVRQPVVLCGHDHAPRTARLPSGKLVVNPGSVGLPAFTSETPYPHAMETGTPHARYSVICRGEAGWLVEDIAVPYEWDAASHVAMEHGRPDWAGWLATGRAAAGQHA